MPRVTAIADLHGSSVIADSATHVNAPATLTRRAPAVEIFCKDNLAREDVDQFRDGVADSPDVGDRAQARCVEDIGAGVPHRRAGAQLSRGGESNP
jgi:ABC-type Fe3+-citrate transport system substrate-binding protein